MPGRAGDSLSRSDETASVVRRTGAGLWGVHEWLAACRPYRASLSRIPAAEPDRATLRDLGESR